jgi:hypothetical protein
MERDEEARLGAPPTARGQRDRGSLRPRHCWEIVRQIPGVQYNCEECYAYFVQQDCWTLWALRRPGFKPCCQKKGDCTECVVLTERMHPQADEQLQIERKRPAPPSPIPLPSSSTKRVCSYLQLYNGTTQVEGDARVGAVTRALQLRNADFRCRLRGVYMDGSYVNDICVSRHIEDCVFLEETRPEVKIRHLPMLGQSQESGAEKDHPEKNPAPRHTDPSSRP